MPSMRKWMEEERGVDFGAPPVLSQPPFYDELSDPIVTNAFVSAIEGQHGGLSFAADDRVYHSHGWVSGFEFDGIQRVQDVSAPRISRLNIAPSML